MNATKTQAPELPGTYVWLVLMKAYRSVREHAGRSVAQLDLMLSEFVVLEMLLNGGPQRVNDIGRRIGMTSGAITSAIDRLAERGLVVRTFDPDDRRARLVELTAAGRTLIADGFQRHAAMMEIAVSGLSESERQTLTDLLKKLGRSADAGYKARYGTG
jgi:MarR family transcriptional regulator, 2-MHQ and catechol-resistance regulon repressor